MNHDAAKFTPLSPHPALLLSKGSEKVLVISDLHIGWEFALAEKGVHVPSQTMKLLGRLGDIVGSEKPDRLIVLGDIKHTVTKIQFEEWRDVPVFFEEACKMVSRVQVVLGNHDGNLEALLPESVEVMSQRGVIVGNVGLFHGHTWPDPVMLGCNTLVIGHLHPIVAFSDPSGFRITRQVWVRAPCNGKLLASFVLRRHNIRLKKNMSPQNVLREKFGVDLNIESLLVMPSFNDFLGGQAVNQPIIAQQKKFQEFIGPVLRSGSANLEKADIYLLDGTFLGALDSLRKLG